MDTITFDDFKKLDIRIGKIISAEKVEGSDKLLKLEVDFGLVPVIASEAKQSNDEIASSRAPRNDEIITRQIIAGIAQFYAPEALVGKECPFAYNLAPRILKGLESQGMILCASENDNPILLHPDKEISPGSVVK